MMSKSSFERILWVGRKQVSELLEVTIVIPKDIAECLKKMELENYSDVLLWGFKEGFPSYTRFYERPSFDSKEVKKLELVAYRIYRGLNNPYLTPEENFDVKVKPKYKPQWIDEGIKKGYGSGKIGWKNTLSTPEFFHPDPTIHFVMNAYFFLE